MSRLSPMMMPFEGQMVPHGLIEVNQKCNISCSACYKSKLNFTKDLEQIKVEVDQMMRERNLSMLTLAGGEPTLHPQLDEVIQYVAGKGVKVQFLTNGFSLHAEELERYKKAGLSKVYVHVDSFQNRSDLPADHKVGNEHALIPLRERLGKLIHSQGLDCALAVTLYPDNLSHLPKIIDYVNQSPMYHRALFTICTDFSEIAERAKSGAKIKKVSLPTEDLITNQTIKSLMMTNFGMHPFGFVASTYSLTEQRWLLFYSFTLSLPKGRYEFIHFDGRFSRLLKPLNWISKKRRGRYPFGTALPPKASIIICLLYALTLGNPREIFQIISKLCLLLKPGATIRQKSFVFQQGPVMRADGTIDYCRDCPDATIRDGVLMPVCTADILHPTANI